MRITFTSSAVDYLAPKIQETGKQLKFVHDYEDCGCAVNGVPALKLIEEISHHDIPGIADPLPFYYEAHHKVYYEENMKIDYNQQTNALILKSDAQIYTFNLRFVS